MYLIKRNGKQGLGSAYLRGFEWALDKGYNYICEMDADFSHNPADCHHCGHCHGTHAHWLGNSNGIELDSVTTHHGFYYLSKVIDAPVTQLLRPPKA